MQKKRAKNSEAPEVTVKYYLNNAKLLPEVLKSIEKKRLSNELATMLMMLTRKYANRPCFSNYTYKEDMIAEALANLCQNALKFDPSRSVSPNPFAFYTSCINNSFLQFLNVEKRHRKIRDKMLVDIGENPSFSFLEEHKSQQGDAAEFRTEINDLKEQIVEAKARIAQEEIDRIAQKAEADAEKLALEEQQLLESSLLNFEVEETIDETKKESSTESSTEES